MKATHERALAVVILLLTWLGFTFSRLAFSPVPWPDGSAFYLPSLELLAWPPHWAMRPQAAFEASYADANFNIMPGHTVFLGLGTKLGLGSLLGSVLAIKALSLIPILLWAFALWHWLRREKIAIWIAAAVSLAALWDPTVRWGQLAIRTEAWIGFFWVLMLAEIVMLKSNPREEPKRLWRLAGLLAAAAWIHYEAVYLVPAATIGLFAAKPREWWRRLMGMSWRTLALLSPWVLYLVLHFQTFVTQMNLQFERLGHHNTHFSNPYLLFHSLFLWSGSAQTTPKFFNLGKAVFWSLIIALTIRAIFATREKGGQLRLSAAIAFWTSFYLWWSKPEVWFTTFCHVTLWAWVALELVLEVGSRSRAWRTLPWAAASFAGLSLLATVAQHFQTPAYYNWRVYRAWVDCIDRQAQSAPRSGPRLTLFQPHYPDVLVELSDRHGRDIELTRTLDLNFRRKQAEEWARQTDVIVLSRFFTLPPEMAPRFPADSGPSYDGPERPQDLALMTSEVELPFGPWILGESRRRHVCQFGPFWANVATRGLANL